jgi:hypothetical protein
MAKRAESVDRWVMVDNNGHYSRDEFASQFSEELAEAYIFIARPKQTVAVRPEEVTVSLTKSPGK